MSSGLVVTTVMPQEVLQRHQRGAASSSEPPPPPARAKVLPKMRLLTSQERPTEHTALWDEVLQLAATLRAHKGVCSWWRPCKPSRGLRKVGGSIRLCTVDVQESGCVFWSAALCCCVLCFEVPGFLRCCNALGWDYECALKYTEPLNKDSLRKVISQIRQQCQVQVADAAWEELATHLGAIFALCRSGLVADTRWWGCCAPLVCCCHPGPLRHSRRERHLDYVSYAAAQQRLNLFASSYLPPSTELLLKVRHAVEYEHQPGPDGRDIYTEEDVYRFEIDVCLSRADIGNSFRLPKGQASHDGLPVGALHGQASHSSLPVGALTSHKI